MDVLKRATQVAATETTVLLSGDSGTGKEVVARFVHRASPRKSGPFIAINCAALPEQLLESELFGYERGAFTGAQQAKPGQIELAAGGVLFLDEVSEMSLSAQGKFLRVLQEREFQRLGGTRPIKANVRVIAATNRDPAIAVKENGLREDLMYRLAVFPLRAPPLREREGDRELLAQHFLTALNVQESTSKSFSKRSMETLRTWSWPGNVRELKNAIYRAFILAEKSVELPHPHLASRVKKAVTQGDAMSVWIGTPLADAQKQIILGTLKYCGGDKRRAAKALGVSLKTLYNRLSTYGTDDATEGKESES
jgi:transcriptional regulator with PAS, ATPase and Fis domain